MAKRNKARKQPVAANATNPSNSAADKIGSALAAVDNLAESDSGSVFGAMAEKLKLAKTSHDAASEEQKKEFENFPDWYWKERKIIKTWDEMFDLLSKKYKDVIQGKVQLPYEIKEYLGVAH